MFVFIILVFSLDFVLLPCGKLVKMKNFSFKTKKKKLKSYPVLIKTPQKKTTDPRIFRFFVIFRKKQKTFSHILSTISLVS